MRLQASAPTRIDLAGGTLDIWPLYLFHEGAQTLNAAISLRARCTIAARSDRCIRIVSEDTGTTVEAAHWSELRDTPELRLLGRILHFFRADGLDLVTHCDSPMGAGIAGSSALNIAVCGAMARWCGTSHSSDHLLQIAMNLEAQAIAVPTGVQDYRPALYGGIAAIELGVDGIRRVPLAVPPEELEQRVVLAYTGASRSSGLNNWDILRRHIDGDPAIIQHFERIRDITAAMRDALLGRDWSEVGRQISAEWETRKRLVPGVSTPVIERLIARAREAGGLAAKVCGAGGGGCLICYADPDRVPQVRRALDEAGARLLNYRIETQGLEIDAVED